MSRLYEALRQMEKENVKVGPIASESAGPVELLTTAVAEPTELEQASSVEVHVAIGSRLVAFSDPQSLGAEKFRGLVTRLENLRSQHELRSLQVTSSVRQEGKSLVAANLAVTLAQRSDYNILLVEGDLYRPTLASLFGLVQPKGLRDWWSAKEEGLSQYTCKLNGMSLWFLSAGLGQEQPSRILESTRFTEAFAKLGTFFDWIIVDSTPMLPTVDANLWSRLIDGTLLVVREGLAPAKTLKQGLASLDNPKLVGVVLNETSEFDQLDYKDHYQALPKDGTHASGSQKKK
jgi:capsular exopolysaccharide synthesis family protein